MSKYNNCLYCGRDTANHNRICFACATGGSNIRETKDRPADQELGKALENYYSCSR